MVTDLIREFMENNIPMMKIVTLFAVTKFPKI